MSATSRLVLSGISAALLLACDGPTEPRSELVTGPGRILYVHEDAGSWTQQHVVLAPTEAGPDSLIVQTARRQIYLDWSPAAKLIAYTSGSAPGIHLMETDGTPVRVLVENLPVGEILYLQWSPDGSSLLYSYGDGVFVLPAQGGAPRRIAGNTDWFAHPAWSPNGREVAFTRTGPSPGFLRELWIVRADGTGERRVPLQVHASNPRWSPDGSLIAFNHSQVAVVRPDGSGYRVLAGGCPPTQGCASDALVQYPRWSPDGRVLAAIRGGSVVLISADGGDEVTVPAGGVTNPAPRWSLDGSRVAFVGWTEDGRMDIFTASRAGDDLTRVTSWSTDDDLPLWVQ